MIDTKTIDSLTAARDYLREADGDPEVILAATSLYKEWVAALDEVLVFCGTPEMTVDGAKDERIKMLLDAVELCRNYLEQRQYANADAVLLLAQREAAWPLPHVWRRIDPDPVTRVKALEADVRVLAEAVIWCIQRDEEKITQGVRDRVVTLSNECPLPHHD